MRLRRAEGRHIAETGAGITPSQRQWAPLEALLQSHQPSKVVEYGSRLAFINALQEGFPELLTALDHDVYRPFESHWKHDPPPERGPTIDGTPLRELLIRVHDGRFPAKPVSALCAWILSFHIRDLWLIDAAIATIRAWAFGDRRSGWHCDTPLLEVLPFAPKFGAWVPVAIDQNNAVCREEFRKKTNDSFKRKLRAYMEGVELQWGVGKDQLEEHAKWTALRFAGLSFEEIAGRCRLSRQSRDSFGAVEKAVRRFAKRIRLTISNRTAKR